MKRKYLYYLIGFALVVSVYVLSVIVPNMNQHNKFESCMKNFNNIADTYPLTCENCSGNQYCPGLSDVKSMWLP